MLYKKAITLTEVEPLNNPDFTKSANYDYIRNLHIQPVKLASTEKNGDGSDFDLQAEIKAHPDSLFVKCFAIKANETNDNGDWFGRDELKKAYGTFVGVPVFTNHQNNDVEKARGKVVHSWYDDVRDGIMVIMRVDAVAYPQLARGIKEGYMLSSSMGASRGYDLVLMSDLTSKRVDELQVGDEVITHTGKKEPIFAIAQTQEHENLYHIVWSGNKSGLALSHEHPVLILKKEDVENKKPEEMQNITPVFIPSSELKSDDYVLEWITDDTNFQLKEDSFLFRNYIAHRIKDVSIITNSEPTYYIQVGDIEDVNSDHSYILNDIATHNCQVAHSLCSICHNLSTGPQHYCSHIKERKTRKISGKFKCEYHKYGTEEKCPLCGSKRGEENNLDIKDVEVHEKNIGIRFVENSLVNVPACHDCGITEVIDTSKLLRKVAELRKSLPSLLKAAADHKIMCTDTQCATLINENDVKDVENSLNVISKFADRTHKDQSLLSSVDRLTKLASEKEMQDLKQAMDLVSGVVKVMIDQRGQVDLAFGSDLMEVLSGLQETYNELNDQGFGRLPPPGQETQTPTSPDMSAQPPLGGAPSPSPSSPTPTAGGASKVESGSAGQVGTVTSPLAASLVKGIFKKAKKVNKMGESWFTKVSDASMIEVARLSEEAQRFIRKLFGVKKPIIDPKTGKPTKGYKFEAPKFISADQVREAIQKLKLEKENKVEPSGIEAIEKRVPERLRSTLQGFDPNEEISEKNLIEKMFNVDGENYVVLEQEWTGGQRFKTDLDEKVLSLHFSPERYSQLYSDPVTRKFLQIKDNHFSGVTEPIGWVLVAPVKGDAWVINQMQSDVISQYLKMKKNITSAQQAIDENELNIRLEAGGRKEWIPFLAANQQLKDALMQDPTLINQLPHTNVPNEIQRFIQEQGHTIRPARRQVDPSSSKFTAEEITYVDNILGKIIEEWPQILLTVVQRMALKSGVKDIYMNTTQTVGSGLNEQKAKFFYDLFPQRMEFGQKEVDFRGKGQEQLWHRRANNKVKIPFKFG